ncbi:N-acetylglucosamine-6-phosphate deacetylase [Dolichospermum circinale]|uniref:N-acetylglucosamine-6-phosphate deacetylase n=1 Tax=Dolichospermum circinale TaxID=109265 RepID=UPI00232BA753|nr:N-acetylglucosamine-6-phosphate deacetylase [Dolichospermum circinale]MDB9465437.1 N-acetylglucosamine-6-phosphate deacetylase [Dolichospermum circinale CS-539/09]MDB9472929.1 N-acetylglucosamine-6-phosphate deacetylase [Dolichospermum circinale CS-539]
MPANINIINAKVPGYQDLQRILVNQEGIIDSIMPMNTAWQDILPQHLLLDVAGDWISLGGVDLQINGGLGLAFPELTLENSHNLAKICSFLWLAGVDAYLPTLVTTSIENLHRSLAILTDYTSNSPNSAQILGVHLEGPFLNYYKRGAHPSEYLLPLTIDQIKRVLGDYAPIVKLITLAPELDTTGKVIPYLRSLGITVSLGHSQATAAESQQAFAQGATMITHAFNAMPPLHHREPGLLGAAINDSRIFCGFIADGQHVNPMILKILLRASKSLFIVSDALAPLGLADGIYPWDNRQIEVINGTARLQDGTLTGTTLPLLVGVQNLVKWQVCDIEKAINLATDAPRKAIDLPTFSPNQPAHLLRWNYDPVGKELSWKRLTL